MCICAFVTLHLISYDSLTGGYMSSKNICAVCAWRADCQKKFSMSGKNINCPDFSKDLLISEGKEDSETDIAEEHK